MKAALPYLFPLAVLILKRHAAVAWLLDTVGHPPRYLVVALAEWSLVSVSVVCGIGCALVLLWNWLWFELPANRRQRRQP